MMISLASQIGNRGRYLKGEKTFYPKKAETKKEGETTKNRIVIIFNAKLLSYFRHLTGASPNSRNVLPWFQCQRTFLESKGLRVLQFSHIKHECAFHRMWTFQTHSKQRVEDEMIRIVPELYYNNNSLCYHKLPCLSQDNKNTRVWKTFGKL